MMRTARETSKTETLRNKALFFFFSPFSLLDSQESALKVPKRDSVHVHTAIRVTPKCYDSCAQGAFWETDDIAGKLLRCRIASEALRRNMPLSTVSSVQGMSRFREKQAEACTRLLSRRTVRSQQNMLPTDGSLQRPAMECCFPDPPVVNKILHF